MNIIFILLILGITQGFFLTTLLVHKQGNRKGNRLLALLVFVYSLYLAEAAFYLVPGSPLIPITTTIGVGMEFLFGPLHYLYAQFIINPYYKLRLKHGLHFLPFIVVKTYYLSGYFTSGVSMQKFMENPSLYYNTHIIDWIIGIKIGVGIVYMLVTMRLLKQYSRRIREQFSAIDKISLDWLRNITILTLGVWLVALVTNLIPFISGIELAESDYIIIDVALTVLIYSMGYLGLVKPEIFSYIEAIKHDAPAEAKQDYTNNASMPKYAKTRLQDDRADIYLQKLLEYLHREKPWNQPNLTLKDLAEKLDIAEYHLSQIINEKLGQNFFNLINGYRVEEVKQEIGDPRYAHLSLLGIAFDSGFNSKSSFNSIFKKHTSMTPTEFLARCKQG